MGKSRSKVTRLFRGDTSMVTTSLYTESLQATLRKEYGPLRNAAKILARMAGVSPRTAQNWLNGANAPQGAALLNLMANNEVVGAEMARLMKLARGDGE